MGVSPPGERLVRMSYVVVDVETTGTSHRHGDRITEIAAVVVRDGKPGQPFHTLVNPERCIPPHITRITGISREMVKGAPRFRDVSADLRAVLGEHVFVAHNAPFDWGFVRTELERAGRPPLDSRRLCTVRL